MKVLLTRLAELDFDEITEGLASINLRASWALVERFEKKFLRLERFPELGGRYEKIPALRRTFVAPYVLYYRIEEEHVEIVRIVHGARDHGPLLDDE
jgi:toxin ParE1/3/4